MHDTSVSAPLRRSGLPAVVARRHAADGRARAPAHLCTSTSTVTVTDPETAVAEAVRSAALSTSMRQDLNEINKTTRTQDPTGPATANESSMARSEPTEDSQAADASAIGHIRTVMLEYDPEPFVFLDEDVPPWPDGLAYSGNKLPVLFRDWYDSAHVVINGRAIAVRDYRSIYCGRTGAKEGVWEVYKSKWGNWKVSVVVAVAVPGSVTHARAHRPASSSCSSTRPSDATRRRSGRSSPTTTGNGCP